MTNNYASLGGDNKARWLSEHRLAITDQTDDERVVLSPQELAALRILIAPPVTNEDINGLILSLFNGLYKLEETELEPMRQIVRDWLDMFDLPVTIEPTTVKKNFVSAH